jgi:cytochrome c553
MSSRIDGRKICAASVVAPRGIPCAKSVSMRTTTIVGVLVTLLTVGGVVAAPKPEPPPARALPAPDHLSPQTRQAVKGRMAQHAVTMDSLIRAVVLLDRPRIRVMASRIADEEVVSRTAGVRDKKLPELPAKFFQEQQQLASTARQLAAAAIEGGDDKVLRDRFSALTGTCVGCHSTYVHDRPSPWPADQKGAGGAGGSH